MTIVCVHCIIYYVQSSCIPCVLSLDGAACPFTETQGTCSTGYIQCYDQPSGTCILPTQCNNGANDCENNSDEGIT